MKLFKNVNIEIVSDRIFLALSFLVSSLRCNKFVSKCNASENMKCSV